MVGFQCQTSNLSPLSPTYLLNAQIGVIGAVSDFPLCTFLSFLPFTFPYFPFYYSYLHKFRSTKRAREGEGGQEEIEAQ
jgi:hypothetical protein